MFASAEKAAGFAEMAESAAPFCCKAESMALFSLPWPWSAERPAAELNFDAAIAALAKADPFFAKCEKADWFFAMRLAADCKLRKDAALLDNCRNALAFAPRADRAAPLFALNADIAAESFASFEKAAALADMAGSFPLNAAVLKLAMFEAYFANADPF